MPPLPMLQRLLWLQVFDLRCLPAKLTPFIRKPPPNPCQAARRPLGSGGAMGGATRNTAENDRPCHRQSRAPHGLASAEAREERLHPSAMRGPDSGSSDTDKAAASA
ncbi:MAG: hypothetical protein WCA35_18220 [Kovacikia sp.]